MLRIRLRPLLLAPLLSILLVAGPALADPPAAAPPAWEQLSPAQRDQLIAPLRERWNRADAGDRRQMLDHARRWQAMTPAERETARHGLHHWKRLSPEKRGEARALYSKLRTLPQAERTALREQWRQMTSEQRRQWAEDNPPPASGSDPR